MGPYGARELARRLITGGVLLTVIVTTFLPGWATQAAPTPALAENTNETNIAANRFVDRPLNSSSEIVPMNALILSDPGSIDALEKTITESGGYIYIRQGDALFVGLDRLNYQELAPVGARAVYQGVVPETDLAALSQPDRDVVETWNYLHSPELASSDDPTLISNSDDDVLLIPEQLEDDVSTAAAEFAPTDNDTSVFMVGSVTVEVVFVESNGSGENWTQDEISKVQSEVTSALKWWTVAATAPVSYGDPLRPSAKLTWKVNYHSPFDEENVKVSVEPITRGIAYAAADGNWISQIAAEYAGGDPTAAAVRKWADQARDTAKTDWGLILYVVDSSADTDNKFPDGKAAGSVLNGPWAVVSSEGVTGGLSNLEVMIAKMVGHIFGAGDETYIDDEGVVLCSNQEYYGYLHIQHSNCMSSSQAASLMRAGNDMISAYRNYQLSQAAREQVGWRDNDANGIYDVMDTLEDNASSLYTGASFVCPNIHLSDVTIYNDPALPLDFANHGDPDSGWISQIYDPVSQDLGNGVVYHKTNINWAGYVWGRINAGDWIGAKPNSVTWSRANEGYNLVLPGKPGVNNNDIDIVVMNRWDQEVFETPLTDLPTNPAWGVPDRGENTDTNALQFFNSKGAQENAWTRSGDETVEYTSEVGAEACFSFHGSEITLWHKRYSTGGGKANVFIDGKLNSTIDYKNDANLNHVISGLTPDEDHTVRLVVSSAGTVDFDAFEITDTSAGNVLYGKAAPPNPKDTDSAGFYEHGGLKLKFAGKWANTTWSSLPRQGTPDNAGKLSIRPLDRIYAYVTQADTVAIYRRVYPGGGTANIYLNGVFQGTMKNHASKSMITPYYISGLTPSVTYSLEIRINNAGDKKLFFDAIRLLNISNHPTLYKAVPDGSGTLPLPKNVAANSAQEKVGTWAAKTGYIESSQQGDVVNVYFQGSAITVRRDLNTTYRQMEVYVDGVLETVLNNTGTAANNVPSTIHGLNPLVPHVLQIRLTYTNPNAAALNHIRGYTVQYFEPVTAGGYQEYEYAANKKTRSDFIYENTWEEPKSATGPSGGHFIESKGTKSRAYLYFTDVNTLGIYGVVGPTYGAVDVYVNGELKSRFTQQSSTVGYTRYLTITGLSKTAINILELRVNTTVPGIPRVVSLDRVVLYDRPVLTTGTYDNKATTTAPGTTIQVPLLQFSGQWKRFTDSKAHQGSMEIVQSRQDVLAFTVQNASSITIYRKLSANYGMADVYIDGKLYTSFNNTTSVTGGVYKQPFEIAGLDYNFNHEIQIKPRVSGSTFTKFDIDYIVVGGTFDPDHLTDGKWQQNYSSTAIKYIGSGWNKPPTGDAYSSATAGERAMVLFKGNAFSTYYIRAATGGKFDLYIDGVRHYRVDTKGTTTIKDVPISVSGLSKGMHTAEIVVVSGRVFIDAFEVYSISAVIGPKTWTLKTQVPSERVVFSGKWTIAGDYRYAKEAGASMAIYAINGNTLTITRQAKDGIIDVYVNGAKFAVADSYVTELGLTKENFLVSGLSQMVSTGTWIELRARSGAMVSISQLKIGSYPKNMNGGCVFEAENLTFSGKTSGYWLRRTATSAFGGFQMVSQSAQSRYYVGVQGVDYLTVYRAVSPTWGGAKIYIDGEFWGTMSSYASVAAYKVPFQVGPLPADTSPHIIEFRPSVATKPYGLDKFECFNTNYLGVGYYENHGTQLSTAYIGTWTRKAVTNASGGFVHQTSQRGARLTVRFQGNKLTIYRTTTTDGNLMTATVDGKTYPISNLSTATKYRVPYTILLPESTSAIHSLELMVTSGVVNFDALEVGTAVPGSFGSYQENSPHVVVNDTVNAWKRTPSTKHSDGAHVITSQKYSNVMFLFYGKRVTTYMTRGKDWGKVRVILDGKTIEEIDLYTAGTDKPFFAYDISGLSKDNHVLELRFEGNKSANGKPRANVDVFSVDGAPVPRPNEELPPADPDTGGGGGDDEGVPTEGCFEEARQDLWVFAGNWDPTSESRASDYEDDPLVEKGMYMVGVGDPTSETPGDTYAQFRFKAEGFGLVYSKDPNGGTAKVYIDDMEFHQLILSMYSPTYLFLDEALWEPPTPLDPTVVHVLRIAFDAPGEQDGSHLYIDRIDLPKYDARYNDNCLAAW